MNETGRSPLEIAIHLRRTEVTTPAVEVGLALAGRLGAWVTGLHVVPLAPVAFASPEAVALYVSEVDGLCQTARAFAPQWRDQLDAHGLDGEWRVSQGDVVESICHVSRWCDLVVVERPQLNPDAPTGWGVVSRAMFGASAPIVVVPEKLAARTVGTHIVVAWNQSREATLAIRGALPLLARADRVSVLEGEPGDDPLGLRYLPKCELRDWLKRHRIEADYHPVEARKGSGPALLEAAHTLGADLVVMGAWGQSRITELVLGGATRHLLQHTDLPLLVAH